MSQSVSPVQLDNNNKNIVQYVYISEIYSPSDTLCFCLMGLVVALSLYITYYLKVCLVKPRKCF